MKNNIIAILKMVKKIMHKEISIIILYCFAFIVLDQLTIFKLTGTYAKQVIYLDIIATLIIYMLASLFDNKIKKIILSVVFFLLTLVSLGSIMYQINYDSILSINAAVLTNEAAGVKSSFADLFKKISAEYVLLAIAIFLVAIYLDKVKTKLNIKKFIVMLSIMVILFAIFFSNLAKPKESNAKFQNDIYLWDSLYSREKAIQKFGMYFYLVDDIRLYIVKNFYVTNKEDIKLINNFMETYENNDTNEYTGIFEGKNLFLIQVESMNQIGIDKNITPNLYKIQNESINFSNYYASTYAGNTSDAEFSTQLGMMPSRDAVTAYEYSNNSFDQSLASLFEENGYNSSAFHCNQENYYARNNNFKNLYGFDKFYNTTNLNLNGYNVPGRWASDVDCFNEYYKTLNFDKPLYSFIVSVSSHGPYSPSTNAYYLEHKDYVKKYVKTDDEEYIAYLSTMREFDLALGELMSKLQADGQLDNSVFIIYGDHQPILSRSMGKPNAFGSKESPMFIYEASTEPQTFKKISSHYDLMPTIANMFGLNYDGKLIFGSDLFSNHPTGFINANNEIITSFNNPEDIEYIKYKDEIFQLILKTNYFLRGN